MKKYNKLVRSRIPTIIKENGKKPNTKVISNRDEVVCALKSKTIEESLELRDTSARDDLLEELCDVQEVINCLLALHKISKEEFETIVEAKAIKQGNYISKNPVTNDYFVRILNSVE